MGENTSKWLEAIRSPAPRPYYSLPDKYLQPPPLPDDENLHMTEYLQTLKTINNAMGVSWKFIYGDFEPLHTGDQEMPFDPKFDKISVRLNEKRDLERNLKNLQEEKDICNSQHQVRMDRYKSDIERFNDELRAVRDQIKRADKRYQDALKEAIE